MLALIHQELPSGSSVPLTTSLTCATQLSWAPGTASTVVSPCSRIYAMQSAIHSTCCSIATGMFASIHQSSLDRAPDGLFYCSPGRAMIAEPLPPNGEYPGHPPTT